MSRRFYVESRIQTDGAELAGAEAHHLLHVMRATIGSDVTLFDGSGAEFAARVVKMTRHKVYLDILDRSEIDRELKIKLVLGVALPKGDRQTWLVEKAVELGVRRFVPLQAARSVVRPSANVLRRLRRTVIETSKQCGRNRLMAIQEPCDVADYLHTTPDHAIRWFTHPASDTTTTIGPRRDVLRPVPDVEVYTAVGPEGGFTDTERQLATAAGWQPLSLGPRTLRVETAAIALASLLSLHDIS